MAHKTPSPARRDVVTLADLAPRQDVMGGSQRRVFGATPVDPTPSARNTDPKAARAARKPKDLAPKSPGSVKGGKLASNHNITLVGQSNRDRRTS